MKNINVNIFLLRLYKETSYSEIVNKPIKNKNMVLLVFLEISICYFALKFQFS